MKIADGETIPATGAHVYTTEVSRIEATCMATGSVTKKCACGAENTETLPIDETNHTKQNTTVKGAEEATCGADGYTGDTYCECGVKIADGETIPATGAHVYTTEVSRTEATCMATGSVTKKCACGAENTETLPVDPSNHTGELVYINNGDDIHTVKCECGETVIEAESHDYTTGTADHTCVCGKVEQFTITWTVNGEKVDETKVAFGAAITAPDYTAPAGYAFSGWTVPSTMPAENITLNATLVKTYKLRLNPDCVGVRIASVNGVDADSLVNAQKYIPVKEGENLIIVLENTVSQREDVFVYDYTIGSAFVDVYQNTTTITIPGDKVTGNVTIFAAGMVNLTVDMAGGYCTDETYFVATEETNVVKMADSMAHAGSSVCIGSYFAREGYELVKLVAADGTEYRADRYIAIKGDLELTAVWEKIPEFTLTVNVLATDEDVELTVPYGANLLEVLAQAAEDGKIPAIGERIRVKDESFNGERMPNGYSYFVVETEYWVGIDENFTMPAADFEIDQDCSFVGWYFSNGGAEYDDEENGWLESGWHYIEEDYDDVEGGAWYYFDEIYLVTGLTRVPYPTEAVGGITYAPDAETLAYAESKGIEFIDADEAWFVFGQDGKFDQTTGLVGTDKYAVNGMLAWHPGVVEVDGEYYYFTGDEVNGGNIMATGDVYVQRNTTDRDFVIKGVYTFGEDGILCEYDGITDMANGTKRYYDDAQLMAGLGLTKVGENYIYVRSNGELVVNNSYYIPANALNIVPGTYEFDENGYMIQPELTTKEGVYFENGAWYYYENGVKAYNKGLITVSDAKWYNGEDVQTLSGTIYVRSNGALATGTYYVTNVDNYSGTDVASGDKCTFDANGLMQAQKNGIVDGKFYVNGKLAYNAGLIEYNGGYIYVRSNGVVVMGQKYWITNVNDTGVVAKQYSFDANGFLQNPEFVEDLKNGIVDGYYYVDGNLAYCAGLIKLSDENGEFYIYVRSNGALATGKYWPTNCNGIDVNGALNFGTDGKCYI